MHAITTTVGEKNTHIHTLEERLSGMIECECLSIEELLRSTTLHHTTSHMYALHFTPPHLAFELQKTNWESRERTLEDKCARLQCIVDSRAQEEQMREMRRRKAREAHIHAHETKKLVILDAVHQSEGGMRVCVLRIHFIMQHYQCQRTSHTLHFTLHKLIRCQRPRFVYSKHT
jgi:hypothetical protein